MHIYLYTYKKCLACSTDHCICVLFASTGFDNLINTIGTGSGGNSLGGGGGYNHPNSFGQQMGHIGHQQQQQGPGQLQQQFGNSNFNNLNSTAASMAAAAASLGRSYN